MPDQGSLNLGMAASSPRVCPSLHRRQLAAGRWEFPGRLPQPAFKTCSEVLKSVSLGLCVHVCACPSGPKPSSPDYGIGCVSLWWCLSSHQKIKFVEWITLQRIQQEWFRIPYLSQGLQNQLAGRKLSFKLAQGNDNEVDFYKTETSLVTSACVSSPFYPLMVCRPLHTSSAMGPSLSLPLGPPLSSSTGFGGLLGPQTHLGFQAHGHLS